MMKNIDYLNKISEISDKIIKMAELGRDTTALEQMLQQMMAAATQQPEPEKEPEKEPRALPPVENIDGLQVITLSKMPKTMRDCFERGDISLVTTKEQFYEDELYEAACRVVRETDRNKIKYLLEQKAKELGGTALCKMFNQSYVAKKREIKKADEEYAKRIADAQRERKAAEAEEKRLAGNMTKYTNLPDGCSNMYIGEGWIADDGGIRKYEESGKTVKTVEACMYPVLIQKLYRPLDTAGDSTRKIEILYKSEDGWHDKTIERESISNANKAIALSAGGVGVTSENVRQFTTAMSSMLKESSMRGALKIVNTLNQLGWDKDFKHFLPYTDESFIFERKDDLPEMMEALQPQGNKAAWYEKFKEMRALNYQPLKVATAALFASVILPMLPKQDSFVVNLYGGSGFGKSALLNIVTSIFSSMDDGGILLDSDNTQTYLELTADTLNNFPIVMDDMSKGDQEKKRKFQQTVMMIANGRGRNRATKDLKQRKKNKFKLVALVSSEQNVTNGWTTNGSVYRVLPMLVDETLPYLDKEKYPKLENIEDVIGFFQNNYGHCGKDFVDKVTELGQSKIIEINNKNLARARKLAKEHNKEGRQATAIAVLLTAEEIATQFLFQDGEEFSDEELLALMVSPDEADQYMRFYNTIIEKAVSNPSKIEGFTYASDIKGEYWGVYNETDQKAGNGPTISIFPGIINGWAKEYDLDINLFYSRMREKDLLCSDAGTNQTKVQSKKLHKYERVIKLKMPIVKPDEEEKKGDEPKPEPKPSFEEAAANIQKYIYEQSTFTSNDDIPF